jgi:replicative DNA helicase
MAYNFDINMLRMMKVKKKYKKYIDQINGNVVTDNTAALLKDFGRYFDTFPEHKTIDFQLFIPRMHNWNSSIGEEILATRVVAIKACAKGDIPEDVETALQTEIAHAGLSTSIVDINSKYAEGEIDNLGYEISQVVEAYKRNAGVVTQDHITTDISTLLEEDNDEEGYNFRLQCLRLHMRGLRGGDFGTVAGRPDRGKTTLFASETTYLAPQIPPHRNILWLNNEGPGRRIIPRIYQAALGLTRSQLVEMNAKKTLLPAYEAIMGRVDKVRIVDIHGMHINKIESIIEAHDAEIVLYDMIDNMRGFENAGRTDERLEKMYQWARECAVKMNHAGIASSQISVEGDGEMFPGLSMLKDSKTGKQGACDWQLMIGASNDPALGGLRYISLPKNKLRREGATSDPRATVTFNPQIARYTDSDFDEE